MTGLDKVLITVSSPPPLLIVIVSLSGSTVTSGCGHLILNIDPIFKILLNPATTLDNPPNLQVLKVHGMFMIKWGVSFVGGIILAIPVITYQIWKFIAPGLLQNERRYAFPVITFSFFSFIIGVLFAYFIVIPFSLNFFTDMGHSEVDNNFSINYYFNYILWVLFSAGLLFELPVIVLILSIIGIVTPSFMRHYRRHAVITILVLSALLTPPDPISLFMMSIPLMILYEISIGISKVFGKKF